MSKVLVTGGAGFIGSNLCEELLHKGHSITILDNLSTGNPENIAGFRKDVEFIEGDIRNEDTISSIMKDVDTVFHLAAVSSIDQSLRYPSNTADVNDTGTIILLNHAVKSGVEQFIFSSSAAVYGKIQSSGISESLSPNPFSFYGVSKMSGEHYLEIFSDFYGIRTISFRFFNVYGPKQNPHSDYSAVIPKFISALLQNKKPTIYGDGKQTRDFIFVKDLVRACVNTLYTELPGFNDCINLGSGKETTILEILNIIKKILNKNIEPVYENPRFEEVKRSNASIEKAEKLLGFKTHISLKTGLEKTIKWFLDYDPLFS